LGGRADVHHPNRSSAQAAFELACSLARDYGAQLHVLHIAPPPLAVIGEFGPVPSRPPEYDRDALDEELCRLQRRAPKICVRYQLKHGDAADEILKAAQETRSDLIVMGTHGRTALKRLVMGSVTEQVVRKAPCPVLTVKAAA
jgi:universal stress protein A